MASINPQYVTRALVCAALTLSLCEVTLAAAAEAQRSAPSYTAPASAPVISRGNRGKKLGDDMECLLEPHLVSNVGSPVEGTLREVLVDRGAIVARGQVIARLNSDVEAATVNLKRAQEDYGQRKVKRNEELYRKNLISQAEKDELETQTQIAGLELKQQQEVLKLRTITSPVSGVVVERFAAPGDRVSQDKILRIAQIDPLNVEVVVPVELFNSIKPGMSGTVRVEGFAAGGLKAQVVVVDRVIDAASGTFGVRLQLANPGNRIPAGVRCTVRF
jgi:RND family efflux transporter MFP subunit